MNILPFRVALAQINVTVGDFEGNARKILDAMRQAHAARAHVMCVPELALAGYPPEDLLLKPGFVADNLRKLHELIEASAELPGLVSVIGFVDRDIDIYNAAAVISEGSLLVSITNITCPITASSMRTAISRPVGKRPFL